MQPLLHFGPSGPQKNNPYCTGLQKRHPYCTLAQCNPYCILWPPVMPKMQPLLHVGAPGLQTNATPNAYWGPGASHMQLLVTHTPNRRAPAAAGPRNRPLMAYSCTSTRVPCTKSLQACAAAGTPQTLSDTPLCTQARWPCPLNWRGRTAAAPRKTLKDITYAVPGAFHPKPAGPRKP